MRLICPIVGFSEIFFSQHWAATSTAMILYLCLGQAYDYDLVVSLTVPVGDSISSHLPRVGHFSTYRDKPSGHIPCSSALCFFSSPFLEVDPSEISLTFGILVSNLKPLDHLLLIYSFPISLQRPLSMCPIWFFAMSLRKGR